VLPSGPGPGPGFGSFPGTVAWPVVYGFLTGSVRSTHRSPDMAAAQLWEEFQTRVTGAPLLTSALLVPVAYLLLVKLRTQKGPPTVSYFIPWVGSALSLGKDPDGFFERAMCVAASSLFCSLS
jgi:hypothetical protein